MKQRAMVILDGGMGRELQRRWGAVSSARVVGAGAERGAGAVVVHAAFIAAGAQVITSNSYAVVPFHIGEERFARKADNWPISQAGARHAADTAAHPVKVAGSLPPLFGSYRPDLFQPERVEEVLALLGGPRMLTCGWPKPRARLPRCEPFTATAGRRQAVLCRSPCRTKRSTRCHACAPASQWPMPSKPWSAWRGGKAVQLQPARGHWRCTDVARSVIERHNADIAIGAYANAFPPQPKEATANDGSMLREDLDPPGYLAWANDWRERGASMIGGCCGIGPEHIAELKRNLGVKP